MFRTVALAIFLGAAIAPAADAQSLPALAKISQDWSRAWEARKLDATLALYSDDAVFMNADGSRISGKANLRKFFAAVLAQYSAHPSLRSVGSASSGDLGYDWGNYAEILVPVHSDVGIEAKGTYLVILRKVAGRWLIAEQMWTGNVPVQVKR